MKIAVLLAFLAGCGSNGEDVSRWSAAVPFRLSFAQDYPFSRAETERAVSEGLAQFAAKLTPDGTQNIVIDYDPACVGHLEFAAVVDGFRRSRIIVCPAYRQAIADFKGDERKAADVTIKHELGHVLGLRGHIPAGLMQAVSNGTYRTFQQEDIVAVCAAGVLSSVACY